MVTRASVLSLTVMAAVAASAVSAAEGERVPKWQPRDFAFTSKVESANPFQVPLSATVEGPGGRKLTSLGFYDGRGTWKVRVAPNAEGDWSLVIHSPQAELDGRRVSFTCVANTNPQVHGGLQVDPQHPHHFLHEDGTRWFALGYECDWLWALDMARPDLPTLNPFLDKLAAHGFSFIILNGYAHDCGWRLGKSGPDDFGPPPMYAWEGTNDKPDHSRFNLAYWQHYDRMMEALHQRGIVAHLLIKVYNKHVNWPANGSAEDDQYFRWLIARYAAYPNVSWDFSKEAHNEKDRVYKLGRLQLIRDCDPYRRLVTVHDDDVLHDSGVYGQLVDYRSDQQHSAWREKILAQRAQRAWPVLNVEYGYEHGPQGIDDRTYRVVQPPEEVCRRAWEVQMAGGYGAYYYTYTAWDVIRPEDTPPGYRYMKNLRDFFEGTAYWRMQPDLPIASDGYCLADPGREYIVFQNSARPFTVTLPAVAPPLPAVWYQPLSGQRASAGTLGAGKQTVAPPAKWGTGPVVLHLGGRARPY